MATTYSPTEPVAGDLVTLTSTVEVPSGETTLDVAADFTEYAITGVPPGSALETGTILGDDGEPSASFTADVPGNYVFTVAQYEEVATPATSAGHDVGATRKTLISTTSKTVYVGASLDFPITTVAGDGITVRLVVHNSVVTSASFVSPTTRKAELTEDSTAVAAALTALEGVVATSLGPDIVTVTSALIAAYAAHRVQGGVHDVNDTTNIYTPGPPYSQASAIAQLETFAAVMLRHFTGASGSSAPWHLEDDTANAPITGPASSLSAAIVRYADLRRCYIGHIAEDTAPNSHTTADATNTLAAADVLTALIVAVLDVWADSAPTTPTNAEPAEFQLQTRYGFRAVS